MKNKPLFIGLAVAVSLVPLAHFARGFTQTTTSTSIANAGPSFSAGPSDGGSSATTPTNVGNNVTFTASATDPNGDDWYLAVCKSASVIPGDNTAPTCPDGTGGWGTSQLAETNDAGDAMYPQMTSDDSGNAIATWYQSDGARNNIWANRFTPSGGWGTAQMIETSDNDAGYPQISGNTSGDAMVVWTQYDGVSQWNVWANRFTPSGGWGTAQMIQTDIAPAELSVVAMDPSGNAIAAWEQFDGVRYNVWANRFTPSGGWGTAQMIETNDGETDGYWPSIASDASGNMIALWDQFDGTWTSIYANRFTPSGGWGTAQMIETNDGWASGEEITMNSAGDAVAAWIQYDGLMYHVWSNRFTIGSGWETAQLIETDTNPSGNVQIAIDGSGNAMAAWPQSDGTRYNMAVNRYSVGSGWGSMQLIESNDGEVSTPSITTDSTGEMVVAWLQLAISNYDIWANRFTPSGGWGTAELIETGNGDAQGPVVASDNSGNVIAIWFQAVDTRYNIFSNRFASPSGGPWAISATPVASGAEATLTYTTSAADAQVNAWYAFACDKVVGGGLCSALSQGTGDTGSPFEVNHRPVIGTVAIGPSYGSSVSVDPGSGPPFKFTTQLWSWNSGRGVAIQTDGKIVMTGHGSNGGNSIMGVVRHNADGSLDTTFGTGGKVTVDSLTSGESHEIRIQPDGKIVIGGDGLNGAIVDLAAVRLNTDGTLDSSFGTNGVAIGDFEDEYGYSMALQTDGKVLVGGNNATGSMVLVRFNTDGTLDTSFGTGGRTLVSVGTYSSIQSVIQQADGKIVAVGGSDGLFAIVRLNEDGSLDNTFDTDGIVTTDFGGGGAEAKEVAIRPDGKIVVAGGSNVDFAFAQYNSDGSLDTNFGAGGTQAVTVGNSSYAYAMAMQTDGKIVTGGYSDNGTGNNDFALLRLNADGTVDGTFGSGGSVTTDFAGGGDQVRGVAIQPDGKIVASGDAWNGTINLFGLARYTPNGTLEFIGNGDVYVQVGVTDLDSSGVADTVDLHVCSTNSFTGGACGGTTLCTATGVSSGQHAQCVIPNLAPIPTAHGTYPVYMFLIDNHQLQDASTANYQAYSVTDVPPTIMDSNAYTADNITLSAGASTAKSYTVTATDNNGGDDIVSATGTLWDNNRSGLSDGTCINDEQWCYTNASCTEGTPSGATRSFTCDFTVWYNADYSSWWYFHLNPADGNGAVTSLVNSNAIATNALSAINVPEATIAYGTVVLGGVSNGQSITLENEGNQILDVLVQGSDMVRSGGGATIPLSQQKWHVTQQNFDYNSAGNVLVSNAAEATSNFEGCANLDIPIRSDHTSGLNSDASLFWKLKIPASLSAGSYSGTNTLLATSQNQCSACGDGLITGTETCDDGNTTPGDGCSNLCAVESGYSCNGQPSVCQLCGNGAIEGTETCDDGNTTPGDGCSNLCAVESGYSCNGAPSICGPVCGDWITISPEACDDGNLITETSCIYGTPTCVACNATCSLVLNLTGNYCGDGTIQSSDGETCDDGNSVSGDGCSNVCAIESGYSCSGQPSVCITPFEVVTSFGTGSYASSQASSITMQSDGKTVAVGTAGGDFALARYNTNGTLDTSFGTDGKVITSINSNSDSANNVAIQSDGKIVVSGTSAIPPTGSYSDLALARYNSDGTLDTTFGAGGKVITHIGTNNFANSVAVLSDGKIILGGTSYIPSNWNMVLAKYNTDGSLDSSFGVGGIAAIPINLVRMSSFLIQGDGKIVCVGDLQNYTPSVILARFNSDGTLDNGFGNSGAIERYFSGVPGNISIRGAALQSDGKILAAGSSGGSLFIARFNSDSTIDTSFGTDGLATTTLDLPGATEKSSLISSIAIQSDGKIVAAGYFNYRLVPYYMGDSVLVRYNSNGTLDSSFDTDGIVITDLSPNNYDKFNSVGIQSDGKILAAGESRNPSDGNLNFVLVRYTTTGAVDVR